MTYNLTIFTISVKFVTQEHHKIFLNSFLKIHKLTLSRRCQPSTAFYLYFTVDIFVELIRGEGVGLLGGDGFDVEVGVDQGSIS